MNNTNDIRHRIKTIQETRKITKAMHLIASSKFNKTLDRYKASLVYFDKVRYTIKDILSHSKELTHPYCEPKEGNRAAYIVIAGDKGLCGSYNHNVLNFAYQHMQDKTEKYILVVGQIARDFFIHKNVNIDIEFLLTAQNPTLRNAREIAEDVLNLYQNDMMDEVYVIYTYIESPVKQSPRALKLLPLERHNFEDIELAGEYQSEIFYHPSPKDVLDLLIPKYVVGLVYGALIQSFAAEQRARMIAMDAASSNADEMIDRLMLRYNQARQAAITSEIAEIVGGTTALNG
jgi:F-type H+-transporting ATPase subunit gamma